MINEFLDIYEAGLRDSRASLTTSEAIHRIVEKTNLLIRHFNLLEDNVNDSIDDFSKKVEYYLNNGMTEEVCKKLDELVENGKLGTIINEHVFGETKSQIDEIKSQIQEIKRQIHEIQNNSIKTEVKYPNTTGIVQKFVLEDNKIAGIRKKYIHCQINAQQWQQIWEDIANNTSNNNGGIWVPFYWAVNTDKVIDATMTLRYLNKWNWQSLGYSKIGIYGIGDINENGCYVYIENKQPTESTIGVTFTICITELYK